MSKAITVIGLGNMGSALARRFLAGGHPTTVWNRTAAKADPLRAAGATVAPNAASAIAPPSTFSRSIGIPSRSRQ